VVAVAYWNSLEGSFHFDDEGILLDPYVVDSGFGWGILRLMQTRPLTFLTFHWSYLAHGATPWGFHVISLFLHAGNTVLIFYIGRRHLRGSLAWLAAALFAVHPIQTQAVNYIFERATLLAAFFALLSLLLFLKQRYAWAVVSFGLSLLAKEEAIALPGFLLIYDLAVNRRPTAWKCYLSMAVLAVVAAARLFYVLHQSPKIQLGFGTRGISVITYALTQSRVIWIYLRLFFFPAGLSVEYDIRLSHNLWTPPETLAAVLLLSCLVAGLTWLVWRGHMVALWSLGFFILLSPSSSIIPVVDLMFEHRVYFPVVFLAIATASLLAQLPRPMPVLVVALVLLTLFAATVVRNRVWRDEFTLWADVIEKSPLKARGYFHLGQAYALSDSARARQLYEQGLKIDPGNPNGHTNLGLILLSQGDITGALQHLHAALSAGGEKPLIWNNIGAAELRRGQISEGLSAFRLALETDPCRFDARWNLIHTLSSLGQQRDARIAGQLPPGCRFLPEQAQRLQAELSSITYAPKPGR
jgi:tetratricopeptide (TPR) repeat protein